MADTNLSLRVMNNTPNVTFLLKDFHGISQPQASIEPGDTTDPPVSAGSDFQVKGYITYTDGQGGVVNINFYMPVIGFNSFSIESNPEGRYDGEWVGDLSGWNVSTVARISPGPGDIETPVRESDD